MPDDRLDMILHELREFKQDTKQELSALKEDICGNGKPGLKQEIKELQDNARKWDNRWKYFVSALLTGLTLSVTMFLDWIKKIFWG